MKTEFTPGPWEYDRNGVYTQKQIMGNVICESPIYLEDSYKNWDANAKLIAAAPDMFEALIEAKLQIEYMQQKFKPTGTGNTVLSRIDTVIQKATQP